MAQGSFDRRRFLVLAGAASTLSGTAGLGLAQTAKPNSRVRGVQIGVITYSFRSMPDQSAAATLNYCLRSGVSAIELMGEPAEAHAGAPVGPDTNRLRQLSARNSGMTTPPLNDAERAEMASLQEARRAFAAELAQWRATASMAPFEKMRKMYSDAGVGIYAFKPSAFEAASTDAEIDYGMRAGKALGASHVTVELPTDPAQSLRLGKAAEKHGMKVGYHQHLQATPTLWDQALAQSPANAINLDIGHYVAAADFDPLPFMEKHHARIVSIHFKDRKTKANGQANMPWGEGNTPIAPALRLIRDRKWTMPVTVEQEYPIPAGSDAVKEVTKCVGICRQALES